MSSTSVGRVVNDDVVVTGLSGRLPESDSIEEFAQQLFDGVNLVTDDDRRWTPGIHGLPKGNGKLKDLTHFDAMFFGVHAKQVKTMDPQMRLLLEVVYETIVDAGLNPVDLRGSNTGVYVAVAGSEVEPFLTEDADKINGYGMIGCCRPMFPNRVSYSFDLKGPSMAVDTACSSSMTAFTEAVNAIRAGICDAAIVAGTNLCLNPNTSLNFLRLGMLSPEGRSAVFDASADGFVRSEAVVAVLLQRRRDARRVYCAVRGARMNTDGFKPQSITYPNGDMQRRLARETFDEACLKPQDIVYLEAHGTGTKVGDLEEVNAIAELFCKDRETPLLLGGLKSNMGHAEIASGMCSLVKIVLAMERGVIPRNLNYKKPNPAIPALSDGRLKVVDKNTPWEGGLVAVNSFGFGGANAHVILEGGQGSRPPPATYPMPRLVLASGRTNEAVERLLLLAAEHQRDAELHSLLDAMHSRAIFGHPRRGYAVLDPARGSGPINEVLESEDPLPVWFVFSGMGSHWTGMARELLRLPTFANSIARSAVVLEPYGVDLKHVITEASDAAFDNIINSFVSIAAVQVALLDVLRELNVQPNGLVGHSLGEIGCSYADGTLTAEQTVLCAYWRGRCTLDAQPAAGAMAAIGLSWEEAECRRPKDVELACHNSLDNVTISGPTALVQNFVDQLSADGVFVKMVDTAGIAFHSSYVASAAPLLRARLQQVIPEPKPRGKHWLSTSVPQDRWDSDLAKLNSAEYHVNNFLSPVRFATAMARVPARALVIEVAPHALLQAVLKRILPKAVHVPLVNRSTPDALVHLLAAVGKTYAAGTQPQVSRLYPAASWPVSHGTPGLASSVRWDHSAEWPVTDFSQVARKTQHVIEYDLRDPENVFLAGHMVDGRILFPATGYIMMVWRTLAKLNKMEIEEAAAVFENVQFLRVTIMTRDSPVRFLVSLLVGSGEFEVCEGGEVIVRGTVRLTTDPAAERLPASLLGDSEDTQDHISLNSEDIYKELDLRGYQHKCAFRGLVSSDTHGHCGLVKWEDNWMTFMDAVLQFFLIASETRVLYLPKRVEHIVIDPAALRKTLTAVTDGVVPVTHYRNINVVTSSGLEYRGLIVSPTSRRDGTPPKLEKYIFVPYEDQSNENKCNRRDALTVTLQLVIENNAALQLKLVEPALQRPEEMLLLPRAIQVMEAEPLVRLDATLVAGTDASRYTDSMDPLGIKVSQKDVSGLGADCHLVLGADILERHDNVLGAMATASETGFVLLEEPAHAFDEPKTTALLAKTGFTLVSRLNVGLRDFVLLQRAAIVPTTRVIIEVRDDDYTWVDQLKQAMKRAEREDLRVYVWSRAPDSGVQGLATCLRREPGGDRLRVYYLPGARDAFDPDSPSYKIQVQRDLAFNVLRDGVWGTFRHLPLDEAAGSEIQTEHAYVNTLTLGDLSSLRWVESELQNRGTQGQEEICRIYYAAINFRDIMLATAKLPLGTGRIEDENLVNTDCVLGFEFSGRTAAGKRIMGIVPSKGLATTVVPDETFVWDVPTEWSLKEAATVPVAYASAYYALCVRGRMRRGESVLIHSGAGALGQAAITVALHAGCTVYTTVGSPERRTYLRERFPQLPDANIGNSRDCSFEQLVLQRTRGRGVDIVLNSLMGDKLKASLRCLGDAGRFLEMGKVDLVANTTLGMEVLLKNSTVHGILLDALFIEKEQFHHEKKEVARCVDEGIAAGVVRPLRATVFAGDQLEEAFRHMATGKHIGKVLIRVHEEKAGSEPALPGVLTAVRHTYMHPGKSYVLVGGMGGFGLELADWLVDRGARTVVLNSRRGVRTGYQTRCIRRWRNLGAHVLVSTVDATTTEGARSLLQEARVLAPVGGIFNLAVVLRDSFIENQSPDAFRDVAKPKIDATRALDVASRELAPELEYFVAFSSMSCGRGNAGQSNYGFANSGMERLCEQRRTEGLPALAVQWGAIGDVGLTAAMCQDQDAELGGTALQSIASCLQALERLLALPYTVVSSIVLADKRRAKDRPAQKLVQAVANILGIRDLSKLPDTATLAELGVDSLMNAEIKQTLDRGYNVLLNAQEIRALTFGKLHILGGDAPTAHTDDCDVKFADELIPKQVLVKLPSQPSQKPDEKLVFMVHPIEGVVDMLREVAAKVRGTVYGLQCTRDVPLDNMATLASFYVKQMRSVQPHPPFTLLGYSLGAGIAFEMALQLEQDGCAARLVLVDGSPAYITLQTSRLMLGEVEVLAYFGKLFYRLDSKKVVKELQQHPNWEARVDRLTELIVASGARVEKNEVRDAANALHRRLLIGNSYQPVRRLQTPVMLFRARISRVPLGEDYGLRAMCDGEVSTRQLAGTHRTIVTGGAARTIADYVSDVVSYTGTDTENNIYKMDSGAQN